MEKTIVFIDGGYLDAYFQKIGYPKVDYHKMAMKLSIPGNFFRAYYYHCLPYQSNPPTQDEKKFYAQACKFFDCLKRLDRFQVRLGKLVKRGVNADGTSILHQKRVDVFLATDLVKFSAKGNMELAVILTADSDYVPAIQAATEFSVLVRLAYFKDMPVMQELVDACDERFEIKKDFFNDLLRK